MAMISVKLLGGALALDFCNTASGRGGPRHRDQLRDAGDMIAWAVQAGVARVAPVPELLGRALALREAIYHSLVAPAPGAPAGDLAVLAGEHAACLARARLVPADGAYRWAWDAQTASIEAVLGPVAISAVELLTRPSAQLKQCPGPHCGWLFLDATRNGSRRWCEMAVCGNRAKQRRRRHC